MFLIRAKAFLKSRPSKLWFLLESTQLQQGVEKPVLLAQKWPRYEKLSSFSELFEKSWRTRSKQVFAPTGTIKNFWTWKWCFLPPKNAEISKASIRVPSVLTYFSLCQDVFQTYLCNICCRRHDTTHNTPYTDHRNFQKYEKWPFLGQKWPKMTQL